MIRTEDEVEQESTVGINFKALLNNPTLSDVTYVLRASYLFLWDSANYFVGRFVIDGREISAHKTILYVSSDHFKAMFCSGMAEASNPRIELADIKYDICITMMEYIYTGRCNITSDNAVDLLIASDKYLLPSLAKRCEDGLIRAITPANVKGLLELAHVHSRAQLKQRCFALIEKYQTTLYQDMKKDIVKDLAQELDQYLKIKPKAKKQKEPEPEIDEFEASTSSST